MAMERPHPRIIRIQLHHHIPVRLQQMHVAPHGVIWVDDRGAVPGPCALVQQVHVVAVHVHGMGERRLVVDDDAEAGVGAEVVDVPVRVEGCVAGVDLFEDWGVVVGSEGAGFMGVNCCVCSGRGEAWMVYMFAVATYLPSIVQSKTPDELRVKLRSISIVDSGVAGVIG